MRQRAKRDDGSVLVLGVGLMGVVLLAISVVVDASMAFIQRQALQARADAAVLAGVQGIDYDAYYAQGATEATALVPGNARGLAVARLNRSQQADPIPGFQILEISSSQRAVAAKVSAPIRTAFWPIDAAIEVRASASLDYVG